MTKLPREGTIVRRFVDMLREDPNGVTYSEAVELWCSCAWAVKRSRPSRRHIGMHITRLLKRFCRKLGPHGTRARWVFAGTEEKQLPLAPESTGTARTMAPCQPKPDTSRFDCVDCHHCSTHVQDYSCAGTCPYAKGPCVEETAAVPARLDDKDEKLMLCDGAVSCAHANDCSHSEPHSFHATGVCADVCKREKAPRGTKCVPISQQPRQAREPPHPA
jgi:hypothetical protein